MSPIVRLALTTLFIIGLPHTARAACTSPAGAEADIVYNQTFNVMQFCNGTDWISMASGFSDIPSGFVGSFNLASCPDGWSEYTLARGRFIRGIDSTGTNDPDGVRALGSTQDDAFESHQHISPHPSNPEDNNSFGDTGDGIADMDYEPGNASEGSDHGKYTSAAGSASETRPKNVALLFCEKD